MTLILNIDSETKARLVERARKSGGDAETIAALLLHDALRDSEVNPDAELTEADWAAIKAAVARADSDFSMGRSKRLSEVIADKAARYNIEPPVMSNGSASHG